MKKRRLKIFLIIFLIVLVIAIIFILNTLRKMQIIKELDRMNKAYIEIDNYYFKEIYHMGDYISTTEVYQRGKESLIKCVEGENVLIRYTDGKINNAYFENIEFEGYEDISKIAMLNERDPVIIFSTSPRVFYSLFDTGDSAWVLFCRVAFCKITTETVDGVECYKIDGFNNGESMEPAEGEKYFYVEKGTGFIKKQMSGNVVDENGNSIPSYHEYELKLNCVTDADLVQPDASEYEVISDDAYFSVLVITEDCSDNEEINNLERIYKFDYHDQVKECILNYEFVTEELAQENYENWEKEDDIVELEIDGTKISYQLLSEIGWNKETVKDEFEGMYVEY